MPCRAHLRVLFFAITLVASASAEGSDCQLFEMDSQFQDSSLNKHKWHCFPDSGGIWELDATAIPDDIFNIVKEGGHWVTVPEDAVPGPVAPGESPGKIASGFSISLAPRDKDGRRGGRRTVRKIGDSNVLVVRATFSDSTVSQSAAELSDSVFGTIGDPINLVSQYAACSKNQLNFAPATGSTVVNGVVEITINKPIAQMSDFLSFLDAEIATLAHFGDLSPFDHIMYVLPPGSESDGNPDWLAFAYINAKSSVYNDHWFTYVSTQMHEIGHNLGLLHSGDLSSTISNGLAYGDMSGYMGFGYSEDDTPVMCFNPAKSFELGWFADCVTSEIFPAAGTFKHLVGQADYTLGVCAANEAVVIQVVTGEYLDLFIGYNRASGSNIGTRKHANKVTLVLGWAVVNSYEAGALSEGQSTVVPSRNGDILVKFCSLTDNKAAVVVALNGPGDPCACAACDGSATCSSSEGAFTCSCNSGYAGSGEECSDVDECSVGTHNCDAAAECTDTHGSFTCACNSGFSGAGYPTAPGTSLLPIWYGNASTSLFPDQTEGNGDANGWTTYFRDKDDAYSVISDDASYPMDMPFNLCGVNGVYIGTNSYITFGGGADNYGNLGPSVPPLPTLFIGGSDNSAQLIIGKPVFEEGPGYVVRFEGTGANQGLGGSPTILWEATLFENGMVRVVTARDNALGVFGLSDGTGNWLAFRRGPEHVRSYMLPGCNSSQGGAYVEPAVLGCDLVCPEFQSCSAAEAFCQDHTESDGLKSFKCHKVAELFGEYECATSNPSVDCIGIITLDGCELDAVVLSDAGRFAVLAGAAVTNAGLSMLGGDLGVSPGTSVTGFDPPGKMLEDYRIHSADDASADGMAALTAAYIDAAARLLCQKSKIGNLGGMTLPPGLYKSTSGMAIAPASAVLTLDAGHNSEAVWIFQMVSTFVSAVSTKIVLKNGAKASNIFWQVGSSGTLGTTSHLEGTMMAYASITLGTGASVNGRVLAHTAAITMLANTIDIPAKEDAPVRFLPSKMAAVGASSEGEAADTFTSSEGVAKARVPASSVVVDSSADSSTSFPTAVALDSSDSTSNSVIIISAAAGVAGLLLTVGGVLLVRRSRVASSSVQVAKLHKDHDKDTAHKVEAVFGDVLYTIEAKVVTEDAERV